MSNDSIPYPRIVKKGETERFLSAQTTASSVYLTEITRMESKIACSIESNVFEIKASN